MKQKVMLLLILALGMCGINVDGQTKKRSPAKKIVSAVTVTKSREIGKDGYVWYKIKKGNLYGAQDIEGKTIIPVKYSLVDYKCDDRYGSHWFLVGEGNFAGAYTIEGDYVVTTNKHYVDVILFGHKGRFAWVVKTNQGAWGLLDVKGNVVVSPQFSGGYNGILPTLGCALGDNCIYITHKNMEGACDLNGNIIIEPQYYRCIFSGNSFEVKNSESDSYKKIQIDLPLSIRYDYTPFGGMFFDFIKRPDNISSSNSSSSSSSSSYSSSSSSNSGNSTTTIHVEHHHDPVPVQQWQACFGCGGMGTMGCDFCGGSGTKYIGDRLHRCSRCNGRGIIPCNVCYGNKGQYVTVYK